MNCASAALGCSIDILYTLVLVRAFQTLSNINSGYLFLSKDGLWFREEEILMPHPK